MRKGVLAPMLQTVKVHISDLTVGMFVSGLDRPWLNTPFYTQGFLLESEADIHRVREYCDFVYVDTRKSRNISPSLKRQAEGGRSRIPLQTIFAGRKLKPYQDEVRWKEEHPRARNTLDLLLKDLTVLFDHVSDGGKLDVVQLKKSVDPIIASISRNPDACLWLARLKRHDRYSYRHSLSAAIWAVAMGREMGLSKIDLRSLAIGAMLMDIGKLRLRPELLQAERELTAEETREMRHHVAWGVDLLRKSGIVNQDVLDMVAFHHERYDGSGYPRGLMRDQIPVFARIAGIVDSYDAMTSERSYAPACSPSEALRQLYTARDTKFQSELVEAFIQAVGIYPAGSLVELTSGAVGIVLAECRSRRLMPKVILVLDAEKNKLARPGILDLQAAARNSEGEPVSIARALEPGAHGIDIGQYQF